MTQVLLHTSAEGGTTGDIVDVPADRAEYLLVHGVASKVDESDERNYADTLAVTEDKNPLLAEVADAKPKAKAAPKAKPAAKHQAAE